MFTGCGTALVTPFRKDGSFDEAAMRRLVRRQIDLGIDFLVPCGTTAESPTLDRAEHLRAVEVTIQEAAGRKPVLAGAGGNNTKEVIELARECGKLGASGILSVTPYYNKPTQEGLFQHYKAIAEAVSIPVILYSVQGRTGINIEPATVERLSSIPNIIGIKEASGNITQIAEIIQRVPPDFLVISGDDAMTIPVIALGGHGIISVASNEIPAEMTDLAGCAINGDLAGARSIQKRFLPLMQINFIEANPIPVKWAMSVMGLLEPVYRLPMVEPSAASKKKIEEVLAASGVLAAAVEAR